MDRRPSAGTARRKPLGGSASPVSATSPEALSDHYAAAAAAPVEAVIINGNSIGNGNSNNTSTSTSTSPQPGTLSRRGSKSLHQVFSFSTPASANRGQGIKRRSRTMDGFDQVSPSKGGHTLRKRARVDYTFEHVDDEVVVPNSTSSRAKKRSRDHGFAENDSEDMYASAAKRRGASLGADAVSALRRNTAPESSVRTAEAPAGDDEDVKDTIEVGVSYSDLEDCHLRRGSNASASSAEHSLDGSWKSAPATSHFGPLCSNAETAVVDGGRDAGQENIDPQLRANPPTSPKPTADMAEPVEEALPGDAEAQAARGSRQRTSSLIQGPDAQVVVATGQQGQLVEPAAFTAKSAAAAQDVSASDGTAAASNGTALPTKPAAEEDEIQQQCNAAEAAAVPDHADTTKSDVSVASPESGERLSSKPDATSDETDSSRTTQSSSSMDLAAQHSAEDAVAAATTDSVEMADTKQSHPRLQTTTTTTITATATTTTTTTIPVISVQRVAPSEEDGAEKGDDADKETSKEEAGQGPAMETTRKSPISSVLNGEHKDSEDHDIVTPLEHRDPLRTRRPSQLGPSRPQPTPAGRWSYLTPYIDGEYVCYPEKKARSDDDTGLYDTATPEDKDADKDADKDGHDMEPMVEDNDDAPDPVGTEAQTPALNTPLRGSPVPDSMDPTTSNSPAPAGDEADDGDVSDSQEPPERRRYYKYRKLRDADEYVTAMENYEHMSTTELYEVLGAINVSLVQWQSEWNDLGRVVDDHENALRRRAADAKYEARTRNMTQHGVNHEEPDFAVKGYKAKERELMSETRYLQGQDRIMSAVYGFEYDPHPSKIGRQNPETQQAGIMTRGRSLRNQPKQTVKASEADEVTGKRQRKPVQLFDPATQDGSRSSTPVPPTTRGRRRKTVNADEDNTQVSFASSFHRDEHSDAESVAPKDSRRRRAPPRPSNAAQQGAVEDLNPPRSSGGTTENEEAGRSGRRRAARQPVRYDEAYHEFMDDEAQAERKQAQQQAQKQQPQQRRRRHLLTLKIPRSKNLSEPSSAITDNGDSRPSSASSDSTSHTAESLYSFRPKRQKRFRDDPDAVDEAAAQAPPRKRGKRNAPPHHSLGGGVAVESSSSMLDHHQHLHVPDAAPHKVHRIKVVRPAQQQDLRNETPSSSTAGAGAGGGSGDGDDKPKDYKSMTKSEKMSASMKSRWANGNMAGAVEKRKATLAAKKAAQVAAESKVGAGAGAGAGAALVAPNPNKLKVSKGHKKEANPEDGHAISTGYASAVPEVSYSFSVDH
ncbi:hypothetical protein E4U41_001075 [Claviceps citrina]|nr:hypothetical protein E4U41_001075 [Claviceps citrina]